MEQALIDVQLSRVVKAGIIFEKKDIDEYIQKPDVIANTNDLTVIPAGYKKCNKCGRIQKLYLFNIDNKTVTKCTSSCKDCQRLQSAKHNEANKAKKQKQRKAKKYYQDHKEVKAGYSAAYYQANKERLAEQHREYQQTKKGKKVMSKAHAKRATLLEQNKGVPYTRKLVIDRDKLRDPEGIYPICYLCDLPVTEEHVLHLDHVIPVVMGGLDCFTNIACTHDTCNLRREKDARKLDNKDVNFIVELSEQYMEEHPESF